MSDEVPTTAEEAFDYYESLTAVCRFPGCDWEADISWAELDGEAQADHARHWNEVHAAKEDGT